MLMSKTLISFNNFSIYTHGTFFVLGVILSILSIIVLVRSMRLDKKVILDLVIYTTFFGIVGARLANFVLFRSSYGSLWEIVYLQNGGLVSFGGFLFGILAYIVVLKLNRQKIYLWLDVLAVSFLLGFSVGRLGSFLSGESFGVSSDGLIAINGAFPVTLVESIWVFLLFVITFAKLVKSHKVCHGKYFFAIMSLYALGRMITDFGRAETDLLFGLSLGQIVFLMVFLFGAFIYIGSVLKSLKPSKKLTKE